jgi:hypothetical protein
MRHYVMAAWLLPPLLTFGLTIAKDTSIFIPRYYFPAFPAAAWVLGSILARIEPVRSRAAAVTLTPNEPLARLAVRVRAVTPGRYVHPAATIEDMYRPQRFGRTGTGEIEVGERR